MKKLRTALLSIVTLATSLTSFGQVGGTSWTFIPWAPSDSGADGERKVHLEKNKDRDYQDWADVTKTYYFKGLTSPSTVQGTYKYEKEILKETFRHYGPYARSVNRSEIRLPDYGAQQGRQFEAYVKLNEKLSSDQAFFQIWGYQTETAGGATYLQLRLDGLGNIVFYGGADFNPIIKGIDFRNREFMLNVIHIQEARNDLTVTTPGHLQIYVNGRLHGKVRDTWVTRERPGLIGKGENYFKYGVYGTVDKGDAEGIFKEARYFKSGVVPGSTPQTIQFNAPETITLGGGDVALTATSSSNLGVALRVDNRELATFVNGKLRPLAVGTINVWASQGGSATYEPAPVVVRTINIVAGGGGTVRDPQTITFPVIPAKLTTDAPFALIATTDSGLTVSYASNNPAVATVGGVSGNIVTIVGPGSANITATQGGDLTYLPADPVTRTLTVTAPRQTQRIDFPAIGQKLVTDPNFNPGATATSGLGVTYTSSNSAVAKIVGDQIDIVGAGTVTITANQAGDASFFPATPVSQTFTVKTPVTYYKIKLRANPTLVLNHVGVPANRAVVNVVTDTGSDNQLWKVIPTTNGYVRIAPLANQAFALDCSDLAPVKGSIVQLWTYDTTNINLRQQWLRSAISGTTAEKVTLRATSTQGAMVLDCEANPAVSGSVVQTWTYKADNTNQRQQWIFEPTVRIE